MNEPEEVTAARRVVDAYQRERYAERKADEERKRLAWVAACVGRLFKVDETFDSTEYRDAYRVTFTARLVAATHDEGEMHWDNGVVTEGLTIYASDALPEPVSPVTASTEDTK